MGDLEKAHRKSHGHGLAAHKPAEKKTMSQMFVERTQQLIMFRRKMADLHKVSQNIKNNNVRKLTAT